MCKLKTKSFIYFLVAFITIIMASVCFPFVGDSIAEEIPINYNDLTITQLQTLRVLAEEEINSYVNDKNLYFEYKSEKLLVDFDNNEYIVYSFSPCGYAIYSLLNNDMIEISPFEQSPYIDVSGDLYYLPLVGYYKKTGNKDYIDLQYKTNITLNEEMRIALSKQSIEFKERAKDNINYSVKNKVNSAKHNLPNDIDYNIVRRQTAISQEFVYQKEKLKNSGAGGVDTNNPLKDGVIYADHEVDNAWYFKYNTTEFANPSSSTCGYKALGLLVCYHEYFSCTGYLTEEESDNYIYYVPDAPFGTSVPFVNDDFVDYLKGSRDDGSDPYDVKSAFNDFMKGKDISYNNWAYLIGFGSLKGQIRANSPTILFGSMSYNFSGGKKNHAVVVYGYYDNGKLLVHYGHSNRSQVILCNYITGGYYGIENKSEHRHNKKYFKNGMFKFCGCGKVMPC